MEYKKGYNIFLKTADKLQQIFIKKKYSKLPRPDTDCFK